MELKNDFLWEEDVDENNEKQIVSMYRKKIMS